MKNIFTSILLIASLQVNAQFEKVSEPTIIGRNFHATVTQSEFNGGHLYALSFRDYQYQHIVSYESFELDGLNTSYYWIMEKLEANDKGTYEKQLINGETLTIRFSGNRVMFILGDAYSFRMNKFHIKTIFGQLR